MKNKLLSAVITAAALVIGFDVSAYSVSGRYIYNDAGAVVQLRGVNWFGFATTLNTAQGLWARNWKEMVQQMKDQGFNAVRLPICPATLRGVTPGGIDYNKNPDLVGKTSLQVLDAVVAEFDRQGMYVLLNHDRPDCQNIPSLWYTATYSEAQWIADLRLLADRYKGVRNVIGIDLKNEPYGNATWGSNNTSTDWNLATGRASSQVLGIAPHWLIFVEGLSGATSCTSGQPSFWGEDFGPMKCTPSAVPASRLVLSPHAYGPDVYVQNYHNASNFPANLAGIWEGLWGYAAANYPVVLGEFGGKYGQGDTRDKAYQDSLVSYLTSKGINSGFYWCWNPNSPDTGGILLDDWKTVRSDKITLLKRLWAGNGGTTTAPVTTSPTPVTTTPPPATTPTPAPAPAPTYSITETRASSWSNGYCNNVQVKNTSTLTVDWKVTMTVKGKPFSPWSAVTTIVGSQITASGVSFNKTLKPGAVAQWGYCTNL